jgi:cell division GTPase FtsZ
MARLEFDAGKQARIKVSGVGGGNAVNTMARLRRQEK